MVQKKMCLYTLQLTTLRIDIIPFNRLRRASLPEKSHGQRNLVGYSPWDYKEPDAMEHTHAHTHTRARAHARAHTHIHTLRN